MYNLLVGGAAGDGIDTMVAVLEKVLKKSGYFVFSARDFMSRIRGGHNFTLVRFGKTPITSHSLKVNGIVAMDEETISRHQDELVDGGFILCDIGLKTDHPHALKIDMRKKASELGNPKVAGVIAMGAVLRLFGETLESAESVLKDSIKPAFLEMNRQGLLFGYDSAEARYKHLSSGYSDYLLLSGNDAIALGALAAGLRFYSAYPMSPSTSILNYLADTSATTGVVVEQAEDEIAAVNMAIGASYAGARAMTASVGGGFALMTEAVSFCGIAEIPLVIGDIQRPGPATGLPTRLPASAIQLAGGGFRIANSLKGDGTWDWRTFGTGDGFTADELKVGRIEGGSSYWDLESGDMGFSQGTIHSADGKSSWDLTGGSMLLGGDLTISGGVIGDGSGNTWDLTSGDMELSGNLTVRGGKIMDASGRNVWDLANSDMSLDSPNTSITGGIIRGAGNNYWNLDTGEMSLDFMPDGVQSQLDRIEDAADSAQWDADMARAVTDRISFTSSGMQISGFAGGTQKVATYTPQGFVVDSAMAEINSSNAGLGIKDWGMAYQSRAIDCQLVVTDGTGGIGQPAFLATAPGVNLFATRDGLFINGKKVQTA